MRNIFAALLTVLAVLCAMPGCSTLNDAGVFITKNQVVVDIATRHAVFRYIDAGKTTNEKAQRSLRVVEVARSVDALLVGDPTVTPETLLARIDEQIAWDKVSPTDAVILRDVLSAVEHSLLRRQKEGVLKEGAVLGFRTLLHTVIDTAALL